jgi:endonuclease-3
MFAVADTPTAMVRLSPTTIATLIYPVGFYRTKSRVLRGISRELLERFDGRVPDTIDELLTLPGVGRKTANLVVTIGFGKPGICVDTHVHRISNRLGLVRTKKPEDTETALAQVFPKDRWLDVNELLVTHGREVCRPIGPRCEKCPLEACPSRRRPFQRQ